MFRIIQDQLLRGTTFTGGGKVRGVHSRPRRYTHFESACKHMEENRMTGDICDDSNNVVAVYKDGKLLGKIDPTS